MTDAGRPGDPEKAAAFEASLAEREKTHPLIRPHVAGTAILDQLLLAAKNQGGVHMPSVATALGSLGGHACQVAALAGVAAGDLEYDGRSVATVEVSNGERFLVGDAIGWPLAERQFSLWSLVAGSAQRLGATIPSLTEMLTHSAETLGGPEFGMPRVDPGTTTGSTPRQWLSTWGHVSRVLDEATTDPQHGPIAFGIAVQQLFDLAAEKAAGRYDFGDLVRLVMDSAIATSKILASDEELGLTSS